MMSIVGETILNLSCIELSMSLSIATNISALNTSRHLGQSSNMLDSVYRRLSSGLRINSAADDAAGLQISNRLTSEVNGTNTAIRNANDGISVINVADGALDESVNLMQRMRTLALQSGSGANTAEDRVALNAEFKQLQLEMDRIATGTRFAGQDLLAGSYEGIFLVGAYAGQNTVITDLNAQTKNLGEMEWQARSPAGSKPGAYDIADLKLSSQPITLNGVTFDKDYSTLEAFVADINGTTFPNNQGPVQAQQLPFCVASAVDLSALPSYIDVAGHSVDLTTGIDMTGWDPVNPTAKNSAIMATVVQRINSTAQSAGLGFYVSASNNSNPASNSLTMHSAQGNSLALANGTTPPPQPAPPAPPVISSSSLSSLLPDVTSTTYIGQMELRSSGDKYSNIDMQGSSLNALGFYQEDKKKYTVDNIDVLSEDNASRAIKTLDVGMKQLGVQRARLGAQANALDSRVRNLANANENLSAARSRIRDADMAVESARLVSTQILQQASASILSQANSRPNAVLSLLQS
ncbi:flagellin [Aeromonas sp. FDAARGOS 1405]|uniref:flagellin N-terminal helical domain-containing protein n=1 Tax=unclassified Aeromonas TaxID=257493 RepID=UPI001C21EC91|nr:flagellin [Aeromonas sp. FDAARGOS 1405]QXB28935.1 flagellin [Aeromonas sp. FDAARGOS 1405]